MFLKMFFLCFALLYAAALAQQKNQKTWDYTVLSISSNSSNEDLIKFDLQIVRIQRGIFGVSGKLIINTEITDEHFVEAKAYRSATGSNNYQVVPLKIQKQTLNHFMEDSYAKLAMSSFKKCSNLPQSIDGAPPVLEKKIYVADQCIFSVESLPSYMPNGFYKILYMGTGPVNYVMEIMIQIETKD